MAKKKGRTPPKIVPRRGPPSNLRPAGAHDDETVYDRKKAKAALRQEVAESGFPVSRESARGGCAPESSRPPRSSPSP